MGGWRLCQGMTEMLQEDRLQKGTEGRMTNGSLGVTVEHQVSMLEYKVEF